MNVIVDIIIFLFVFLKRMLLPRVVESGGGGLFIFDFDDAKNNFTVSFLSLRLWRWRWGCAGRCGQPPTPALPKGEGVKDGG